MAAADIRYGLWSICFDRPPIPVRNCDWSFSHENFDASWEGEEDGYVTNGLSGYGASVEDCKAQIADIEEDRDMPLTAEGFDCAAGCPLATPDSCLALVCPHRPRAQPMTSPVQVRDENDMSSRDHTTTGEASGLPSADAARQIEIAFAMYEALVAQDDAERIDGEHQELLSRASGEGWDGPTAESHINEDGRRVTSAYARARELRAAALAKAEGRSC
jgi:hypothetical protein